MTLDNPRALAPTERLRWLEDPGRDFPFYNGAPVGLSAWQWLFIMAAVVVGFAVLVAPIPWPAGPLGAMIPAVLFPLIPMVALAQVAPGHWENHLRQGRWAGTAADARLCAAAEHRRQHERRRHRLRPDRCHNPMRRNAQLAATDTAGAHRLLRQDDPAVCSAKKWSPCCLSWP